MSSQINALPRWRVEMEYNNFTRFSNTVHATASAIIVQFRMTSAARPNLSPDISESLDSLLSVMEMGKQIEGGKKRLHKLIREATNLAAMICMLAFISDDPRRWTGDWLEQILRHMVEDLKSIQHFIGRYTGRNALLRTIDRKNIGKYRKMLASMGDHLLVASLRISLSVNRDVAEESIQSASRANRVVTPPVMDAESSRRPLSSKRAGERTKEKKSHDADDAGASSEEIPTISALTSDRRTRKRDATAGDTVLTSAGPYSVPRPNDHCHCYPRSPRQTEPFPTYALPHAQWPMVQVVVRPEFRSEIDQSHHRTTYGSYYNEGQHTTMHGSSSALTSYFADPDIHSSPNINDQLNVTANDRRGPSPRNGFHQEPTSECRMYGSRDVCDKRMERDSSVTPMMLLPEDLPPPTALPRHKTL